MSKVVIRGAPLHPRLRSRLAAAVVAESERRVAEQSGCSRQSIARALGGLSVYRGTVALIERYLDGREKK